MSRERRASWGCNQDAGGGKRRLRYWADLRDGKGYRRVSETVEGSRREADEVLAMRRVEHSRDVPCATVAQAFELWWLPDARDRLASGDISRNTLDNALSRWRAHVGPAFGPSQLRDVKPLDVQAWLLPMTSAVAASSLSLLNQIYRFAVMYGACESNPAALRYRMPKARAAEPDRTVYDSGALWAALRAVEGTCAYLPAVLCGIGSARVGESLGVKADEVCQLESHGVRMAVAPVVRQMGNDGRVTDHLKTAQSARPLIVPEPWGPRVMELAAEATGRGEVWLCDRGDGTPIKQERLRVYWAKACASAGVEPKQPRAARRSWETYMRWDMGVEQSRIEQMMGHTLGGVTGAHYDKPTARLFADAVSEAFSRKPFIR